MRVTWFSHIRLSSLALPVLLLVIFLVRLHGIDVPLNRDEATYAYVGSNWRSGMLPYRDVFDHKPPLAYLVYLLLTTVRDCSPEVIRLGASVYFLGSVCSVWLLANALMGRKAGLLAAAVFGATASSHALQGIDLNTEHILLMPATLACYFAVVAHRRGSVLLAAASGMALGLAIAAKPVGLVPLGAMVIMLILAKGEAGRAFMSAPRMMAAISAGALAALLPWALYFGLLGGLHDLIDDVFTYNRHYLGDAFREKDAFFSANSAVTLSIGQFQWSVPATLVILRRWWYWLASAPQGFGPWFLLGGLAAVYVLARDRRPGLVLAAGYYVLSFVGAKMALRDFPHYFVPVLPGLAVMTAYVATETFGQKRRIDAAVMIVGVGVGLALLLATATFAQSASRFFGKSGAELAVEMYGDHGRVMSSAEAVADQVRSLLEPNESMFVAGAEPEVYWLAGRIAPTRYIYDYPAQHVAEAARDLESVIARASPKVVIVPRYPGKPLNRVNYRLDGYVQVDSVGTLEILIRP